MCLDREVSHNERVERLWRDVTRCVSKTFIDIFNSLEAEGVLDPLNEVDMFVYILYIYVCSAVPSIGAGGATTPTPLPGNLS